MTTGAASHEDGDILGPTGDGNTLRFVLVIDPAWP
jgi:hypothetical protein